jgi:hypothetical protein
MGRLSLRRRYAETKLETQTSSAPHDHYPRPKIAACNPKGSVALAKIRRKQQSQPQ